MGGMGGTPDPDPVCGDGIIDDTEECDDGDSPPASSDGCSATCTEETGWSCSGTPSLCVAAACGDRIIAGTEMCDDGNANACGTCSANCGTAQPSAAATGGIRPGAASALADGNFFTLNDGANPPVEFEFDATPGDGVVTDRVAIVFDPAGDATALQTAIIAAIDGVTTTLTIDASAGTAPNVNLVNEVPGSAGNRTTAKAFGEFVITNMTGGRAHDCATGSGCNVAADCASGVCNSTSHTCN
jgi:cysteine-rich repeat protein